MGKYGPIYMSIYDGADYALVDLVLTPATFDDDASEDDPIGTLSGMSVADSALSIVDDADGAVKLDGNDIVVGAVTPAAGTIEITVRETNIYGTNNPHDTVIEIVVAEAA